MTAELASGMDGLAKRMSLRLREMEMALTVQARGGVPSLHSARYCCPLSSTLTVLAITPACTLSQTQADELPTVESTALAAAVGTLEGTVNEVRHDLTQLHELAKVDQQVIVRAWDIPYPSGRQGRHPSCGPSHEVVMRWPACR